MTQGGKGLPATVIGILEEPPVFKDGGGMPGRSVGECATWIETCARQAIRLEKQDEEIAQLRLRRMAFQDKVGALRDREPRRAFGGAGIRVLARRKAFDEVLALLEDW